MKPDNYEIVKSFVADTMIVNTAIKVHAVYKKVKDAGYMKTAKAYYSKADIAVMMDEIRNEWADQSLERRQDARTRQLREIQLIKTRLHEKGDYKTLERYLRLEKDLLGTNVLDEQETIKEMLQTSARILALEEARKAEQRIIEQTNTSTKEDYLEIISQ